MFFVVSGSRSASDLGQSLLLAYDVPSFETDQNGSEDKKLLTTDLPSCLPLAANKLMKSDDRKKHSFMFFD